MAISNHFLLYRVVIPKKLWILPKSDWFLLERTVKSVYKNCFEKVSLKSSQEDKRSSSKSKQFFRKKISVMKFVLFSVRLRLLLLFPLNFSAASVVQRKQHIMKLDNGKKESGFIYSIPISIGLCSRSERTYVAELVF